LSTSGSEGGRRSEDRFSQQAAVVGERKQPAERANKPNPVAHPDDGAIVDAGGGHSSGPTGCPVARAPYPQLDRTGPIRTRRKDGFAAYVGLLAVGFAMPRRSPGRAVRSYRTFSPLPAGADTPT